MTLRTRWLGTVPYQEGWAVQRGLHDHSVDDHLLLLEHPHVFTWHRPADLEHVLVPPADVGAELIQTDRGGDVTYHGPGQLVGYPIVTVPTRRPGADGAAPKVGMGDTVAYVRSIQQLIVDVLGDLGLSDVGTLDRYPGVWVEPAGDNPRKICAVGVRITRGRSLHGFALNVHPDMRYFDYIVPCGLADKAVTSLVREGVDVSMREVVDAVAARAALVWGSAGPVDRQDVVWRHRESDLSAFSRGLGPGDPVTPSHRSRPPAAASSSRGDGGRATELETTDVGDRSPSPRHSGADQHRLGTGAPTDGVSVQVQSRLAKAGVTEGLQISARKPEWLRSRFRTAPGYLKLKHTMRDLGLVTVCEEAGCPNIFECWADGTATFMINGERCTRACGFCLVDTRHPQPLDVHEPERVAEAVERMGLRFAVVTAVARDDLPDGGAGAFAETIRAIRRRTPQVEIEVLVPDCKGDGESLAVMFDARPDVLNHNVETVPRLQRAVRPSAGYARSLSVLARAKEAGLTTKSGLVVGMGETDDEVLATLADLRGVGVDIVTIGQYLRPTTHHIPVARWIEPATFDMYAEAGHALGIPHVESSPLTRSSYHARQAADALHPPAPPVAPIAVAGR
jgi:lipoyl synthase